VAKGMVAKLWCRELKNPKFNNIILAHKVSKDYQDDLIIRSLFVLLI